MLSKNRIRELRMLHLKKHRDQENLFITEGIKSVAELLRYAPEHVRYIYATKPFFNDNNVLLDNFNGEKTLVSEEELEKISLQSSPNQAVAICSYFEKADASYDFSSYFSLFLDEVRDPGNFGTIIRLADWFGISKIYCAPGTCDLYNPKVIQSSMGAFLRVKVVYMDLENLLLKHPGITVYGTVLGGKNLYKEKLKNGLILIGNEANGIPEEHLKYISTPLTIPSAISNKTESLNAAIATGIVCSEFYRQLQEITF
jgi:RNA methyltransferase, TrmH family